MKLLLFKILFLFTIPSFAQRGIIIGKASEKNLNKGIEFANVTLYIAKDSSIVKGVLTDSIGNFELNNLNKGTYILKISSIGFNFFYTNYLTIDLDNSIISLGSLSMEVDQKVLQEVIVNGERPAFERQTDRIVLNVSTNSLYKTSVNALDILKKAPNLQVKANGSIVMRGIITPKYLINGKPIQMDEEELKNYLNTLTPDMIESIDIITNPSSKYDSEFKGIIDIKLKNDKTLGWKGNYNCTVLKNEYFSWNNGINLTYKTKKLIFSNQLSYNNGTDIYEFYSNQKLPNKSVLITDTKRPLYNQTTSYQFGIDYSLKEKQSFSILLKGFNSFRSKTSETFITNTNDNQNVIYNKTFSKNYSNPRYNNYSANINYEANFDSKQLSIFASIANIHNSEEERIININSFNNSLSSEWRTDLNKNIFIRSIQIDFSKSIQKGKIELGAKFAYTSTKNNLGYDTLINNNKFQIDSSRTNRFNYDEFITASYFSYSKELKKWNYKIGFRIENTYNRSISVINNVSTQGSYFRLLPNVNINYTIDENKSVNFSYNRLLTRPTFYDVDPFRFYLSPLTYSEGNPYLLPTTISLFSLTYNYKTFDVSLNAGLDLDPISQLPFFNPITNVTAYLRKNLLKNEFAYSEISHTFNLSKWWKLQHNIGIYYNKTQIPYLNDFYSQGIFHYTVTGNNVFILPKGFIFDLSYDYKSISGDALYISKATGEINIGLQKKINKINIKLNVNDILYTLTPQDVFRQTQIIESNLFEKYGTRKIILQLNYRFGKSIYQEKYKDKTEEENRAIK